ncbi:MAG: oligopeptide/dipeptide ABC transporter ATP-binding protein [Dorea sp.]|nr:oligopeptide/dipeptide ABC transporter ATP-binding protein [Dorea sp.]
MDKNILLHVEKLCKYFPMSKRQLLKAVDDVSFDVYAGETLGLVGESGCGKTTCGRTAVGMYPRTSGSVTYKGKDVHALKGKEKSHFHKEVQTIFQDPYASLNPKMKVIDIVAEGMDIQGTAGSKKERENKVEELLIQVGLSGEQMYRYVHEFSGGQRQRIGIARALAVDPEFIFCDEPISALDVSIQAQIVNLLVKLQKERALSYLFIAHDLAMVKYISDRVAVMYLGSVVELAETKELYNAPLHPYTKSLLSAVPVSDPDIEKSRKRIELIGEVPSPINLPEGCKFAPRCPQAKEECKIKRPEYKKVKEGHFVACHFCSVK